MWSDAETKWHHCQTRRRKLKSCNAQWARTFFRIRGMWFERQHYIDLLKIPIKTFQCPKIAFQCRPHLHGIQLPHVDVDIGLFDRVDVYKAMDTWEVIHSLNKSNLHVHLLSRGHQFNHQTKRLCPKMRKFGTYLTTGWSAPKRKSVVFDCGVSYQHKSLNCCKVQI